MLGLLTEGMRVVIPFGNRKVEGIVLGFCETSDVPGIKDIINIADEDPILGKDLLQLAGWMAERYLCTKLEALHSIMPTKARSGHKYVVPTEKPDLFRKEAINSLIDIELDIYNYTVNHGVTLYDDLRRKFGAQKAGLALKKLTGLELIETVGDIKGEIRPRFVQTVKLCKDMDITHEAMALLEKKAPKQSLVLQIVSQKGELALQDLLKLAQTTSATVRELARKGCLEIQQTEVRRDPYQSGAFEATNPLNLTQDQEKAYNEIISALELRRHKTFLLHGVTGSGKTEVYLQVIARCIGMGREAIVLVPEISLTPQMVERFKGRFGDQVAVLHSRLSAGERHDEWRQVKNGLVKVVVGARSAIFAPFSDLGLVIIDEEHETSYKQEESPRYHAREVAIARARLTQSMVVLGSATPALESYTRAIAGKYSLLRIDDRVQGRPMPAVDIIDLREEMHAGHRSIFSRRLIDKIKEVLARGEQVILFLNRRGYSTFVVCRECGLVMKCPKCSISLTLHAGENLLRCHYCDFHVRAPELCPKCSSKSIRHFGIGTQKVEEEAAKWFSDAKVARMDMDTTTRKGSHEKILNKFKEGKIDILVGTQMIAKGLDFPNVTLVGVITADTALNLPDFRAAERTFQLLTQVAGRAGRGENPGEVVVQSYNPEHYSILAAQKHDYRRFYHEEMLIRQALEYPPYSSLVRIVIYGTEENSVIRGAEVLAYNLRRIVTEQDLGIEEPLLGPAPAPLSKIRNRHRWQLCIRGKPGQLIRGLVRQAVDEVGKDSVFAGLGITVDVDPISMM